MLEEKTAILAAMPFSDTGKVRVWASKAGALTEESARKLVQAEEKFKFVSFTIIDLKQSLIRIQAKGRRHGGGDSSFSSPFEIPARFEADGKPVLRKNHGFTSATVADLDRDGAMDLILGWYNYEMKTKTPSQRGTVYFGNKDQAGGAKTRSAAILVDGLQDIWSTY